DDEQQTRDQDREQARTRPAQPANVVVRRLHQEEERNGPQEHAAPRILIDHRFPPNAPNELRPKCRSVSFCRMFRGDATPLLNQENLEFSDPAGTAVAPPRCGPAHSPATAVSGGALTFARARRETPAVE